MLKGILNDGTGPVYVADGDELARRLDDALAALRPGQRTRFARQAQVVGLPDIERPATAQLCGAAAD
jgi:hypothetical protein